MYTTYQTTLVTDNPMLFYF